MRKFASIVFIMTALSWCSLMGDSTNTVPGMPEMGVPPEMKELAWLVGKWDIVSQEKADPTKDVWNESKAECEFRYTVDGAAFEMNYQGSFMGAPFSGHALRCWNRFTKEWQMVWTDNMSAMLTMYTGQMQDGNLVFISKAEFMGQPFWTRLTSLNVTPTSYDWTYEESMDGGKTWRISAKAKYTKRQ